MRECASTFDRGLSGILIAGQLVSLSAVPLTSQVKLQLHQEIRVATRLVPSGPSTFTYLVLCWPWQLDTGWLTARLKMQESALSPPNLIHKNLSYPLIVFFSSMTSLRHAYSQDQRAGADHLY